MATRARASRLACDGPKWLVSLVETLAGPNFSLLIRYVGQQQSHIAEFLLCQKTVTCLQDWKPCQQSHKALKLITHQETTLLDWWKIERKSESDYNSSWREHGFLYKLKYLCLEKSGGLTERHCRSYGVSGARKTYFGLRMAPEGKLYGQTQSF